MHIDMHLDLAVEDDDLIISDEFDDEGIVEN